MNEWELKKSVGAAAAVFPLILAHLEQFPRPTFLVMFHAHGNNEHQPAAAAGE